MSQTTNAVIAELMDRRLLNDVDDDLHQEIADAVIKAARLSRPDTAEARLREAVEDAIDTLESMNLHVDNPLYERLCKALSPPSGGDEGKRYCDCFGDLGLCASTFNNGVERCCDLCGWPVRGDEAKESEGGWVVRKGGYFYRPKAQGYTASVLEAGRWTEAEARAYTVGVEGVTAHQASEFYSPSEPSPSADRREIVARPRVSDNDRDEVAVTLDGKELRGWSYTNDQERRTKMLCAREFVEGFYIGRETR